MTQRLFEIMNAIGSEWVLILLLFLSVATLTIIIQKASAILRLTQSSRKFWRERGDDWLRNGDTLSWKVDLTQVEQKYACPETEVMGLLSRSRAVGEKADRLVLAYLEQVRVRLEKNVGILGTVGSNAPFIGLLGTVLGIIRAFHNIGQPAMTGGMDLITGGISEALVSTAIGLFVAIPSVLAFNFFSRQIGLVVRRSQNLASFISPMEKENSNGH